MAWQHTFTAALGPGIFSGITLRDWFRLLRANRFMVHPRYAVRWASASACSLANSFHLKGELRKFGEDFTQAQIEPPVFVLGHWRSGTTHLHYLLTQDDRFAFPTMYQVFYPSTFLKTEATDAKRFSIVTPETRGDLDNVKFGMDVPGEDEIALANMTGLSPYTSYSFPRRQDYYDRFLTLENASPEETETWKAALTLFLKKLTWKHRRPLILKSPTHTARIKLLLELFPDAKFVHVRRNPLHVFRSTRRLQSVLSRFWRQGTGRITGDDRIVRQYREMYAAYFEQRRLIPEGQLHEVSFEDLEADPVGQLRVVYDALNLPAFDHVEPKLREYVESVRGYSKNRFDELPAATCDRLAREWQVCFEEWGYTTGSSLSLP